MTEFKMVPFEIEHGRHLLDADRRDGIDVLCEGISEEAVMEAWKKGVCYTLLLDGEPVVSSGIIHIGFNRGEAWTLVSSLFYKHRKTCFKRIKEMVGIIAQSMELVRVQSTIRADKPWADRWMKHLGFEREGLMKRFGPNGEDFVLYSRIFERAAL